MVRDTYEFGGKTLSYDELRAVGLYGVTVAAHLTPAELNQWMGCPITWSAVRGVMARRKDDQTEARLERRAVALRVGDWMAGQMGSEDLARVVGVTAPILAKWDH